MKISRKILLATAITAILLAGVGASYAWFSQNAAMATLLKVLPPDSITIVPVASDNVSVELTELDLDFREGLDSKDNEGKVSIRRPVCIRSTSPVHQLEVVHTTNLNDLQFDIYPTTKTEEGGIVVPGQGAAPLSGSYINLQQGEPKLAQQDKLPNYEESDTVELHAYPLYWLAEECAITGYENDRQLVTSYREDNVFDPATQTEKTYYSTYYILEISWKEVNKETDLFYIMAQNIAVEGT